MVWGMLSAAGECSNKHRSISLQFSCKKILLSHCKMGKAVKLRTLKWPAQSLDLNQIENLWKLLGDKVMAKNPTTVTKLWRRLEEEGIKITPEQCEKPVIVL